MAKGGASWGTFRSADGKEVREFTTFRKLIIDNVEYKRVPKPKPKSRSERLADAAGVIENIASDLQMLADNWDDSTTLEELKEKATEILGGWGDWSGIEELKEEMETWRDNLDGANMSHLPKYDEVSEAYDALEQLVDELDSVDADLPEIDSTTSIESYTEAIREIGESIENAISLYQDVNFPGMF